MTKMKKPTGDRRTCRMVLLVKHNTRGTATWRMTGLLSV